MGLLLVFDKFLADTQIHLLIEIKCLNITQELF